VDGFGFDIETIILNYRIRIGYGVCKKKLYPIILQNLHIRTPLMHTWCEVRNFAWHRTGYGINLFGTGADS